MAQSLALVLVHIIFCGIDPGKSYAPSGRTAKIECFPALKPWDHALAVCLAQESLKEIVRLKIKKPGLLSRSMAK